MIGRGTLLCACAIAFVACANGGGTSYDDGQSGTGEGGAADSPAGATDTGAGPRPDGAGSSSGVSSGSSGSSSSGGDDGGQGGDAGDDGGGGSCTATDTCTATASMLGTIAGDKSGATETAMGTASEWLRIDLQEKDSSPLAVPMKLTATLTSPAGTNFDLYAYLGGKIGTIVCSGAKAQSTNGAGQVDTVSFQWGETGGGFANGSDDSATVMLEVRWISGACGSTDTWSLSAHGH